MRQWLHPLRYLISHLTRTLGPGWCRVHVGLDPMVCEAWFEPRRHPRIVLEEKWQYLLAQSSIRRASCFTFSINIFPILLITSITHSLTHSTTITRLQSLALSRLNASHHQPNSKNAARHPFGLCPARPRRPWR